MKILNLIKKILMLSVFLSIYANAFQSHNPYVKYISKNNDKILKLNYVYKDYYDMNEKKPNLVVEELQSWMFHKKHYSRKGMFFKPDYNLPRWSRSYPNDYSRTVFDRGHNASNYDWSWNKKYQKETFRMSNISPQTPGLNRYLWKTIEGYSRYLAKINKHVYVYTGSFGNKGYIGKHHIVVPVYWYKLILVPATHKSYLFVCKNIKYPRKKYTYKDITNYLVSLKKFNSLNKDFNLKVEGKWEYQKTIVKNSVINKIKNFFKLF